MRNQLKPRIDILVEELKSDLKMIALKDKDDEWKRDHYRYTFTVSSQRIFALLNTGFTVEPMASVKESTKKELVQLKELIEKMTE